MCSIMYLVDYLYAIKSAHQMKNKNHLAGGVHWFFRPKTSSIPVEIENTNKPLLNLDDLQITMQIGNIVDLPGQIEWKLHTSQFHQISSHDLLLLYWWKHPPNKNTCINVQMYVSSRYKIQKTNQNPSKNPRSKRPKPSQRLTKSLARERTTLAFGALASSRKPVFTLRAWLYVALSQGACI